MLSRSATEDTAKSSSSGTWTMQRSNSAASILKPSGTSPGGDNITPTLKRSVSFALPAHAAPNFSPRDDAALDDNSSLTTTSTFQALQNTRRAASGQPQDQVSPGGASTANSDFPSFVVTPPEQPQLAVTAPGDDEVMLPPALASQRQANGQPQQPSSFASPATMDSPTAFRGFSFDAMPRGPADANAPTAAPSPQTMSRQGTQDNLASSAEGDPLTMSKLNRHDVAQSTLHQTNNHLDVHRPTPLPSNSGGSSSDAPGDDASARGDEDEDGFQLVNAEGDLEGEENADGTQSGKKKKRRRKRAKVHPLLLLPRAPWRVKVRAFFFPKLHRQALVVQDLPIPLEDPMFGDWFEHLMVIAILINVVILALFDPFEDRTQSRYKIVFTFQVVITCVFQAELILRGIALGVRRMLSPTRFIDAALVLVCFGALIAELAGKSNRVFGFSVLRTPRLLRPVKNLGALPAVMILVDSLSQCMVKIADASLLFFSFVIIFAVACIGVFGGALEYHCVNDAYFNLTRVVEVYNYSVTDVREYVCGASFDTDVLNRSDTLGCFVDQTCDTGLNPTFNMKGYQCPDGYSCVPTENPVGGFVGFDNVGQSFLTLFVSSTQQMWFQVAGDAADATDAIAYFYMAAFLIVCILLLNLLIVIITVDFDLARQRALKMYSDNADGQKPSTFQGIVQELIKQKKAAEAALDSATSVVINAERSDNMAVAAAQDAVEQTRRAVTKVETLVSDYIVDQTWFFYLTVGLIVLNLAAFAYLRWELEPAQVTVIDWVNFACLCCFTAETVLRFLAKPFREFLQDRLNIFDIAINTVGWVDFVLGLDQLKFLSVLRVVRALKLLRLSPGVYHWMGFILMSIKSSPVVLVMIFFVVLMFALIGMQLLGGNMCGLEPGSHDNVPPFCYGRPRYNFDDFGHALITSFQVITGDNWNDVMYAAMEAEGGFMGFVFSVYFFAGNYVLLSLFVGILLSARSEDLKDKKGQEKKEEDLTVPARPGSGAPSPSTSQPGSRAASPRPQSVGGPAAGLPDGEAADTPQHSSADLHLENTAISLLMGDIERRREKRSLELRVTQSSAKRHQARRRNHVTGADEDGEEMAELRHDQPGDDEEEEEEEDRIARAKRELQQDEIDAQEAKRSGTTKAQLLARRKQRQTGQDDFLAQNYEPTKFERGLQRVRDVLQPVLQHWITHVVTIVIIIAASVAMAIRDPIMAPDLPLMVAVDIIDTMVKAFYLLETAVNILAYGFVGTKTSYLRRDRWNAFDFFIALVGLVALILKSTVARNTIYYKLINSLLALRPLSLVKYSPSMNLVARALGGAVVEMRFAFSAIFLVIFIYAVIGTQLFMGKLRACVVEGELVRIPQANCTAAGGAWENQTPSFDNVGDSLFSLFVVLTLELWSVIMYRCMDFKAYGLAPVTNASASNALYFIVFAIVGGFIMVNIFMSVLVDCYNRSKRSVTAARSIKLMREQNGWIGTNRRLLRALPREAHSQLLVNSPTASMEKFMKKGLKKFGDNNAIMNAMGDAASSGVTSVRSRMQDLIDKPWFQNLWFAVIMISFLFMAVDHHPSSDGWRTATVIIQEVITGLFALEAAIKMVGEGPTVYFASKWNRFDFFVVVISIFVLAAQSIVNPRLASLFRSLRILRLARVLKGKSSLSELVHKFALAVAALGGVAAVIFVFFFMFAIMAMELFGRVHWTDRGTSGIGHQSNFGNLGHSLFMLLRITFGGDWWFVWWGVRPDAYGCSDNLGNCGPPDPVAQLFFVVFIGFANFVLKNLLVAVLVDHFSRASDLRALNKTQSRTFIEGWRKCDPNMTMSVSGFDVLPIIRHITRKSPIGFNGFSQGKRVALELRMLMFLRISDPHRRDVKFESVVDMLCHMAYEVPPPDDREFQMALPEDVDDDTARLSATLIMINMVAKRIMHKRRQRKAAEAEAARRATSDAAGGGDSSDAATVASNRRNRNKSFVDATGADLFAAAMGDPDALAFDDSDDDDLELYMRPKQSPAKLSSAAASAMHPGPQSHEDMPDFDDSDDDDDDLDDSDYDDDLYEDGDEDPQSFLGEGLRKAGKHMRRGTKFVGKGLGKGIDAVAKTRVGRGVSFVAKKTADVVETAAKKTADVVETAVDVVVSVPKTIVRELSSISTSSSGRLKERPESPRPGSPRADPVGGSVAVPIMADSGDVGGRERRESTASRHGVSEPLLHGGASVQSFTDALTNDSTVRSEYSPPSNASFGPTFSSGSFAPASPRVPPVKRAPAAKKGAVPASPPAPVVASPPRRQTSVRRAARADTPPPEEHPPDAASESMEHILMLKRHI